jgi:hypothetical protein
VTAEDDWLPASVLDDIARREAELAAWIEVAGGMEAAGGMEVAGAPDPTWERAVATVRAQADFEAVADTALELANAGFDVDLATPPAEAVFGEAALAEAAFGEAALGEAVFDDTPFGDAVLSDAPTPAVLQAERTPRPPTTHRRAARRHYRISIYAALGALVGAAATAAVLLLPHGGHDDPQPYRGPLLPPTSATSPAASPATQKTAPPAPSGKGSGPRRTAATSASGSPR